jgi:serine/threonine protein kinase
MAVNLFLQICEGVKYAHSMSVIHRDIQPKNIFLRIEGKKRIPVVGDFGICYIDNDGIRVTLIDEPVGARFFIPPELEDGRGDVTTKADTYSLGKLLYWLLSGGKYFAREKHREKDYELKGWNDDRLTKWNDVYMEHYNRILDMMINENPDKRREVDNIILCLKDMNRLYVNKFSPVGGDIPQPCNYCGEGIYISQTRDTTDVHNFGFNVIGPADWRIYVCNYCDNVQLFRYDKAKPKEWWKE